MPDVMVRTQQVFINEGVRVHTVPTTDVVPLLTNLVTLGTAMLGLATAVIATRGRRGGFSDLKTRKPPGEAAQESQRNSDKPSLN